MKKNNRKEYWIDGSGNGVYGYSDGKNHVFVREAPLTNNQAEFLALLQLVMDLEWDSSATVYTDSQLLYHQIRDEWKSKDSELRRLKGLILTLMKEKELDINLQWVGRESNLFGKMLDKDKERNKKKLKKVIK